jgi:hypothetical protein
MLLAVLLQCAFFTTMNEKAMDSFQSFRASPHAFISSQQEHLHLAMQATISETKYYVSSHFGALFEDDADDSHDDNEQPYILNGQTTKKNNSVLLANEGTTKDCYGCFSTTTRQAATIDHSLVG